MTIAHPGLLIAGIILFAVGVWMVRWSSRNSVDLRGAALSAGLTGLRRGRLDVPADIKSRFQEIANESSNTRRAAKAGGTVIRHFVAQALWFAGLVAIGAGLLLAAAGVFWT